jgi:hypothetical protein
MTPFRLKYLAAPTMNLWAVTQHRTVAGRQNATVFEDEQPWMWSENYKEYPLSMAEQMERAGQPSLFTMDAK